MMRPYSRVPVRTFITFRVNILDSIIIVLEVFSGSQRSKYVVIIECFRDYVHQGRCDVRRVACSVYYVEDITN